jgi:hypothetical protein
MEIKLNDFGMQRHRAVDDQRPCGTAFALAAISDAIDPGGLAQGRLQILKILSRS